MSDPRLTPANGRVAAETLRGVVTAERYVSGAARQLTAPLADLRHAPGGRRQCQVRMGEGVTLYEERDGAAFVQLDRDRYVGYLPADALGPVAAMTHRVCSRATHIYRDADFKSPDIALISFGARVRVTGSDGRFCATPQGFIASGHLAPLGRIAPDPVAEACVFLGAPYLWGGDSSLGIDCSGLVQAALLACGIACPRDSDQQQAALGHGLSAGAGQQPADLLFWKGHVAMAVDPTRIIHANAHHMAVAIEPAEEAIARIAAQGDGPVIARRRLPARAAGAGAA